MLTDARVRSAKPKDKPYKLYDGGGLYLYVTVKGTKSWRYDYRQAGKRKTAVLGTYPELTLQQARLMRDEFRLKLKKGTLRQSEPVTFRELSQRWFETKRSLSPGHVKTLNYRLNAYILPYLGDRTLNDITRADVLELLEKINRTGRTETARRVQMIISGIFNYAIELGLTDRNPAERLLKYFPESKNHFPAILEPSKIGKLIRDIENSSSGLVVKLALKFLMYTFVRPGEMRMARWDEFDLKNAVWDVPSERTKTRRPHRVFLSRQVLEILHTLNEIPPVSEYVFRGMYGKPLSEITLNRALQRMGYDTKKDITAHGFRAMARTLIHEKLGYPPEVIEHQLGHVTVSGPLGNAYDRTLFYEQRKKMMQDWADYLDGLARTVSG